MLRIGEVASLHDSPPLGGISKVADVEWPTFSHEVSSNSEPVGRLVLEVPLILEHREIGWPERALAEEEEVLLRGADGNNRQHIRIAQSDGLADVVRDVRVLSKP